MKRLLTKQDREQSRTAQFTSMLNNGWQQIDYKNLTMFVHYADLCIKTFWGTAANHTDYYRYRTLEQLTAKIEAYKQNADSRERFKAEQKERNAGHTSSHAATSAAIRTELKKAFPNTKFSVTSETFSMGNSVNISWKDGATTDKVKKITSKYQYGHFNGMEDIYENTNDRNDIPQVKYVTENRTISESIINEVIEQLKQLKTYSDDDLISYRYSPEQDARQLLYITDIPNNYTSLKVVINTENTGNLFKIVFEVEETEPQPTEPQPEIKGKIQIVDYSDKSFAVIGEFSEIYNKLIELGGSYNKFLKCGRGVIFPKTKLEAVKAFLIANKAQQTNTQEETQAEPQQEEEAPQIAVNESDILPTPTNNPFNLESFKIIWHEGRHIENATFTDTTFTTWEEVQRAFYILWLVNEKGQDGGYSKVKCEIKLTGEEADICRIDITNKVNNGDFNPSCEHITTYLQSMFEPTEQPTEPTPETYTNLTDINQATKGGKVISLLTLFDIVNQ